MSEILNHSRAIILYIHTIKLNIISPRHRYSGSKSVWCNSSTVVAFAAHHQLDDTRQHRVICQLSAELA